MLSSDELGGLIKKFVSDEIALNQEDISSAVVSKQWLLDRIKAKIDEKLSNPSLYGETPFIGYGSYFVRVKVANVDEMDFLVVIDSKSGQFRKEDGAVFGIGLGTAVPNHKYDQQFMKADGSGISPKKLLEWLRGIVSEVLVPLGGEEPVIDGPAVKAVLKSKDIKFDLVPCGVFEKTDGSGQLFYNIPNGKTDDGWTLTNPDIDRERVDNLAEVRDEFRNVIRLIKYVRDSYSLPLSSYTVQCAVCDLAENNRWYGNLHSNLRSALLWLARLIASGVIADGFDPKINLLKDVPQLLEISTHLKSIDERISALEFESDSDLAYKKLKSILQNKALSESDRRGLTTDFEAILAGLNVTKVDKNPWSRIR